MKPPPFLLAVALLFWGWETGMIGPAILLAIVLETARILPWRWDFSDVEFRRIWDLCALLFLGAAGYCFLTRNTTNELMQFLKAAPAGPPDQAGDSGASAGFIFFQWWPLIFFPYAAAQAYSVREQSPLATFSWYLRRQADREPAVPGGQIHVAYPYLAVCLAATSVCNRRDAWFYTGLCLLTAWALWPGRPRRFSASVWLALLLLVAALGYGGHTGLHALHGFLENKAAGWISGFNRKTQEGLESVTAIGRIGKVKLSGKIVLRLEPEGKPPALLREASFNTFRTPNWMVSSKEFATVAPETDLTTWRLLPTATATEAVHISGSVSRGSGILAIPNGTVQIENLPVGEVRSNHFGTLRTLLSPGFVRFRARSGARGSFDSPPDEKNDLKIPAEELAAVGKLAGDLNLHSAEDLAQKLKNIESFFENNFQYSTWLKKQSSSGARELSPVSDFLLRSRSGHCEYFATATVLLLRAAGIPARYANGYSVQEQERNGGRYVIRERHAHAWCLYFDPADEAWHDFDTTPGAWVGVEAQGASFWEPLGDAWSRLGYEFLKWRWLGSPGQVQNYVAAALGVLVLALVGRLFFRKSMTRRTRASASKLAAAVWPGADSEFYLVEARLEELGLGREAGEPLSKWLQRMEARSLIPGAPWRSLLSLHYRYRFDPDGLVDEDRAALASRAQEWLAASQRATESHRHPV